jgi:peptide/nickel transport system substrate-binding protein
MLRTLVVGSITSLIFFSIFLNSLAFGQINSQKKGAFAEQIRFVRYLDESLALQEMKAGKIDTYFFSIPLEVVSDAKSDPSLKTYFSTGGFLDLFLNPAPAKNFTRDFNPFSIRQVRFAMNYLINRDFVVNEILKGYGVSRVDPYGQYSPEYLNIINTVESFGFRYNPSLADRMISEALTKAGALKDGNNGKWFYNGKPVVIKILIRNDISYRKSLGEEVASELEKIGFNVVRDYGDLNKANVIVYGSDPQDLRWNIYPEGFQSTGFAKYNPGTVGQMYAPWLAQMPGNQNSLFWNYKNDTLDRLTQKIILGNFSSEVGRTDLLRTAVKMGIQESVRVFAATNIDPFITTKNVRGFINDFGSGIANAFSLINGRLEDNRTNINIGMKEIYVGAWNPIAGYKDTYSQQIASTINDGATFSDPYKGEVKPFRAQWTEVQTRSQNNTIRVPPDAIIWDPLHQNWMNVGGETTSISKVTYDLKYSKWHNGIMMDKNDILYDQYFLHEWGTNTGESDKTKDSEFTSGAEQSIKHDKGIRFLSDDKIESYFDFWHFDKSQTAGAGALWASEPWEITAASERLVKEGLVAFSKTDAASKGIDWLSLITADHANMIKKELEKMKSEGFVPSALNGRVTLEEVDRRYDASIKWITEHNSALIGNGPFYFDNYNPSGGTITLKAFRDISYPFEIGHWNVYLQPKLASIENIIVPKIIQIGKPADLIINVTVDGKPSQNATINYYISNRAGYVVLDGIAKPDNNTDGRFLVQLGTQDTKKLTTGPNAIKIFANSYEAYKPDVVTKPFIATNSNSSSEIARKIIGQTQEITNSSVPQPLKKSGCLIATAAFGSELAPEVQGLRQFRDNLVSESYAGSRFLDIFNQWYYSFSPYVAQYERDNPSLQFIVRTSIYPLLGILNLSELIYHSTDFNHEFAVVAAGLSASSLIGVVYLLPFTIGLSIINRKKNWIGFNLRAIRYIVCVLLATSCVLIASAELTGFSSIMMLGTALLVLSALSIAPTMSIFLINSLKSRSHSYYMKTY